MASSWTDGDDKPLTELEKMEFLGDEYISPDTETGAIAVCIFDGEKWWLTEATQRCPKCGGYRFDTRAPTLVERVRHLFEPRGPRSNWIDRVWPD